MMNNSLNFFRNKVVEAVTKAIEKLDKKGVPIPVILKELYEKYRKEALPTVVLQTGIHSAYLSLIKIYRFLLC